MDEDDGISSDMDDSLSPGCGDAKEELACGRS